MSSSWGASLVCDLLFAAGVARSLKIMGAVAVLVVLLFIVYLMLRSLGLDRNTPPSMVLKKLLVFVRSMYAPYLLPSKLKKAEEIHDAGRLSEAIELYLNMFFFDGLTSSNPEIAIHNETVLERIEEICAQTSYAFPADRINRFREDLFDYFLVKQKHLSPADYDGTPLHRAENEERFKDKLNLSQERALIEGFEHFLTTLVGKIEKHIKSGVQVLPRGTRATVLEEDSYGTSNEQMENAAPAVSDPFRSSANPFGNDAELNPPAELTPPSDLFGAPSVNRDVAPPPGLFGAPSTAQTGNGEIVDPFGENEPNPFSIDDPHDPFRDSTGVLHKLPGAEVDQHKGGGSFAARPQPSQPALQASMPQAPVATGAFPGLGTPPKPAMSAPSAVGATFPQPTSGFPGLASPPGFPQPTGAFPGFGNAPVAGANTPQPTSGFPGLTQPTQPQPATNFPGIGAGFPQPTGGFPGFNAPPPTAPLGGAGFPQQTGGFPGFGSQPAPPMGNFPQPTGGFPGFNAPPPPAGGAFPPNPFQQRPGEKKD